MEENTKEVFPNCMTNEDSRLTEQMGGDVSVLHRTRYTGQGWAMKS